MKPPVDPTPLQCTSSAASGGRPDPYPPTPRKTGRFIRGALPRTPTPCTTRSARTSHSAARRRKLSISWRSSCASLGEPLGLLAGRCFHASSRLEDVAACARGAPGSSPAAMGLLHPQMPIVSRRNCSRWCKPFEAWQTVDRWVSTPCVKKSFTEPNYFPYLRESSADSTATDPSLPRLTDTIMPCLLQLVSATTERAKVPGSPEGAKVSMQAINQLPFEQARFISSNFSFEAGPGPFERIGR